MKSEEFEIINTYLQQLFLVPATFSFSWGNYRISIIKYQVFINVSSVMKILPRWVLEYVHKEAAHIKMLSFIFKIKIEKEMNHLSKQNKMYSGLW